MLFMADVFNRRIPSLKSFDPVGLVKNFEESVRRELDFIHESINVQRFHLNFESDKNDHGFIHSPAVFQEFTTSKVLTLEYIDGTKVSDYPRLEAAGIDRKVVARRLADSYFKQVFEYGFFHADPHPGNIFVLKENQICYLDYGMMGNILKKDIEQLATIFLAVRARDVRKIIRALQMLTDGPAIKNYRLLESDLYEFVENNAVRSIHSNELSTLLLELKDIIVKHGLKVPSHFFLLARSLVAIEAVIHGLDPDFDLTHRAKPYFIKAMTQKYDPLKFGKSIFNSIYEMGVYLEEFPRDFKNAIRKINTGEIKVDLHHKGVDPLVHTINRASKQLITAMIIAALIVGSALLIVADEPGEWHAKSKMGVAGLIVAGILAIGLINDLRKGDHDDWKGWDE
jgi:ubiquinone biosynthesis protein